MLRPLETVVRTWTPTPGRAGDPLGTIVLAWAELVGPEVARNARPSAVDGSTLIVTVRSSAWSQQLAFLAEGLACRVALLPGLSAIERIRLRVGRMTVPGLLRQAAVPAASREVAGRTFEPLPPEADSEAALARLRQSVRRLRAAAPATCPACGSPQNRAEICAPCANARETARRAHIDRALFETPWLGSEEFAVDASEVEAARERLLLRWWGLLGRARRERRLGPRERAIAISYVLLHSRLPPHAVTPAIVRNLLGAELATLLDGAERPAPLANGAG